MEIVLQLSNVTKKFGETLAVNDVSLQVHRGEVFGFLGPNGSGKTTAIRMMTGRIQATKGQVQTLGFDLPKARAEIYPRIGVVTDQQSFYERLSARENLGIFARLHGLKMARVDALLARFELTAHASESVKGFSLGMRQKLLLARAFLGQPEILFLDEPTRGLDPHSGRILREMIRAENARGCTIFLTTHYMEEADQLCDRVGLITEGRLAALDAPATLKSQRSRPVIDMTWQSHETGSVEELTFDIGDPLTAGRMAERMRTGKTLALQRHQPSLEDVFLELTGTALNRGARP
jgi:ABC-2 type transport system ATP-binding protein